MASKICIGKFSSTKKIELPTNMQSLDAYLRDISYFNKFRHKHFYKACARSRLLLNNELGMPEFLSLFCPEKLLPAKFRTKSLSVKYKYDLRILARNMPRFFNDDSLEFLEYSLDSFYKRYRTNDVEKIFSALDLVWEIFFIDQYCLRDFIPKKSRPVILDCGANIGIFSLFAHYLNNNAEIHAFEPAPEAYSIFASLLEDSGIRNIHLHKNAVGAKNRESILLTSSSGLGISNIMNDSDAPRGLVRL